MEYSDNVIIQNGIEVEVDDEQYFRYLKENHKLITFEILESLGL